VDGEETSQEIFDNTKELISKMNNAETMSEDEADEMADMMKRIIDKLE